VTSSVAVFEAVIRVKSV